MLTELQGKSGALCQQAREGEIHCPLIVRPTSEDVITGHLFGTLKMINPRWWLPDLLNQALGTERFRRQVFRDLRIELWQKQPFFPRHLLKWEEGQTEVDVVITWENPVTTVFIEMKYGSPLSAKTANNNGQGSFPADQLIRNARIGLYQCGWYDKERLFEKPRREFVLILLTPTTGNPLVQEYRNPDRLRSSIPHGDRLKTLPKSPFLGELGYRDVVELLKRQQKWLSKPEQRMAEGLKDYLEFKVHRLGKGM
ncbi:MAG TPA: hypothetical protein VNQ76_07585 [Planctomicrobium sp.]|nr:hypothetical protein [Planctomicrobium sp.]